MKRLVILILLSEILATFAIRADELSEAMTPQPDIKELKLKRNTGHFIYVSGGPALILTEVDMGNVVSGEPTFSGQLNVGYEWISPKKFGFGVIYNGYFTGVECTQVSGWTVTRFHERWGLHYFGTQLAGRILLRSPRWSLRYAIGFGLVVSREIATIQDERAALNYDYGLGTHTSFGAEFMLSKTVGISGGVNLFDASIKQRFYGETNNGSVVRVDVNFGLSFHF